MEIHLALCKLSPLIQCLFFSRLWLRDWYDGMFCLQIVYRTAVFECNILFGTTLKVAAPGEFIGSFAIPLPVGSVLILNGNGADVAKHCVPAVPTKRISITFRKMDPAKRPFSFKDDPELLNIAPLETVVQDTGRSSDESKSRTPDAQIRNLSKISRGKRSKGRTSAGKAERGILGDQPAEHVEAPAVDVFAASAAGERNSGGRSRESRYHSDVPGMPSQVDDLRERRTRSAQERRHGNGMSSGEDGMDSGGGRQRMEHRQISFINRTIRDDIDSLSVTSRESADRSGSMVRTVVYNKPRRTRVILDD
ncbi:hypothetical protein PR202_ga18230 [Eleusine coracana subsp. coracana]|uniref:Fe2OG dioxygenase domain-containing protein n=1 Tax=Eleusine coracana subsp. coracana TaxID=191504 RepID=A0AAV5CT78_ELECO|nr:hypothetical protein PR202_ga18230 [Eleusine coracana subsp. coracana]